MSKISEKHWKSALTSIIEELDEPQYRKMLEYLTIPKSLKSSVPRENMPETIIQHYGVEKSISAVSEAVDQIPRRDSAVQDLLRPFVDKLRNNQEKQKKATKRKRDADLKSASKKQKQTPAAGSSAGAQKANADELKNHEPDQERKIPPWRKTIQDVKFTDTRLDQKAIVGKVVQKSGLRTYIGEGQKKFFFYLAVADDTDVIKVMVYGRERFQQFKEEQFYLFRDVIIEETIMKVTKCSKISKTKAFDVPEDLDLNAQMLLYSQKPVCSIAEAGNCGDKTLVSVEGNIKEVSSIRYAAEHMVTCQS
ncbi:uncharacterized protein LOC103374144 [Stegastes partitus]|uniref:Uncharacterized protein LOC103374144 n=1 Tax=Stegastes partitus TaxID=144197 RepID=A0A9Y4NS35_9TELE|nr:PREDICTED: uncharacterized protein LOC103374144 [Stegastes partitus]